jgi:selenocysteine lyase/cysteine desulfurase
MIPVNLREIGCDSFAISGHKWLGGPHESGALFIRRDRLADVALISAGAHSGALDFLPGEIELIDGTARHEYGSRNAGLISGLAEAARFQTEIGRERIAAHGHALASAVADGLAGVEGLTMISPRRPELRGSMVTFAHARASAGQLFGYLREHHGLRCRPVTEQGLNAVRVSMHVFNSAADSDRVIAGFRAAARAL